MAASYNIYSHEKMHQASQSDKQYLQRESN